MENNPVHSRWKWQEYGTAWKGVGIYHVTLSVAGHRPVLGRLVVPKVESGASLERSLEGRRNDDAQLRTLGEMRRKQNVEGAYVERSELGKAVVRCMAKMSEVFPQIRLLKYTVMESHVHFIIHVTEPLPVGIQEVLRRFWRSCEKEGRVVGGGALERLLEGQRKRDAQLGTLSEIQRNDTDFGAVEDGKRNRDAQLGTQSEIQRNDTDLGAVEDGQRNKEGMVIFPERPYIRPLSRKGQLPIMVRYVERNPARLATKRLYPEYFHTLRGVEIAGRRYDAVGNMAILLEEHARTIHVHMRWSNELRDTGRCEALRTYKNECVLSARDGVVLVSPCVNPHEREVMEYILREGHRGILILMHGMTDFYQPAEWLREACAGGRVLILSPWSSEQQEDVGRAEFVHLNTMADEIVAWYGGEVVSSRESGVFFVGFA